MDARLEKYLDTIDKCLKPLPVSERVDIVKEIKSSIIEMENGNLSAEQIMERLGEPKDLAKAYLGDLLAEGTGFSWNRVLIVCAFYSVVGFSGLFIIPTLAIVAPVFMFCGVLAVLLSAFRFIDWLLKMNIPYMDKIGIQFGNMVLHPIPEFFVSILVGVALYLLGKASWKLLVFYCSKVGKTKKELAV